MELHFCTLKVRNILFFVLVEKRMQIKHALKVFHARSNVKDVLLSTVQLCSCAPAAQVNFVCIISVVGKENKSTTDGIERSSEMCSKVENMKKDKCLKVKCWSFLACLVDCIKVILSWMKCFEARHLCENLWLM